MFGIQRIGKALIASVMTGVMVLSLVGCGGVAGLRDQQRAASETVPGNASSSRTGNISEVSPPEVIRQLRQALEGYQPQVAILSPQLDEVLQDNKVKVKFQVRDLPIFKNQELDMGPHLHVIVDNQPYIAVYDLNQPLDLSDLEPGTHTIRVFASRPWHESFKNEGAYAQTTFHIFTKTQDNSPDSTKPLLTYSRPKGSYGAEPILLDFYLTNAPLHLVAQEDPKDDIADWRIRCTINGNSFELNRWEAVYLKGFKPGKNWVQLQFLDEQGPVKNAFNNTVRVITYEPKGQDTLSKLVRGELSAAEARGIVDPNYTAKIPAATSTPAPTPILTPSPEPTLTPSPTPLPSSVTPSSAPSEQTTPGTQIPEEKAETGNETKESAPTPKTEPKNLETKKPGGFFSRRHRPAPTPSPIPSPPNVQAPFPQEDVTVPQADIPEVQPSSREQPGSEVEVAPLGNPESKNFNPPSEKQKSSGFFNRYRRPSSSSPALPTIPELINPPASEPVTPLSSQPGTLPELGPSSSPTPSSELAKLEEEKQAVEQPDNVSPEPDAPKPKLDVKEILLP